jgi:hypothetical protein
MTTKKIKLGNIYIGVTHLSQKGGFYSKKTKKITSTLLIKNNQMSIKLVCFSIIQKN